jgi:hypothetical protein
MDIDTQTSNAYTDALKTIEQLSREEQVDILFHLLRTILPEARGTNTESPSAVISHPRERTLNRALGLLATNRPAPSDEEVEQWLEEHRQEKYG